MQHRSQLHGGQRTVHLDGAVMVTEARPLGSGVIPRLIRKVEALGGVVALANDAEVRPAVALHDARTHLAK